MALVDDIDRKIREAIRARDLRDADVLRMLKTRITERRTAAGFSGEISDDIAREVIATYVKQLEKALAEYGESERAAEARAALRYEIEFCRGFLPGKLGEDESRALVHAAIAAIGAREPREAGKVVGHVMKSHDRALLDATLLRRLAEELLAGGA